MMDLIYLVVMALFACLAGALAKGCARLAGGLS